MISLIQFLIGLTKISKRNDKMMLNIYKNQNLYKIEKGKRLVFPFPAPKNTVKFNFTNAILGKYICIKYR